MSNIVYLNNKYIKFKNAKISIEDRGLQFSDSVYEVIKIINNKLLDFDFHMKRLKYSTRELNFNYVVDKKLFKKIFNNLIKKNNLVNGIIYLQITRGVQSREHGYKKNLKPTVIIYTQKKNFNLPNQKLKGVKVITYQDLRWARRDIKTTNLLPNILAENIAHKKKAYTAILIDNNKITEGVHSNIWIVRNNIIYANSNATEDEVRSAAKLSFAEEFINKLPNKYETMIGENGLRLSGGEKQRLSIARAMIKKSPIILLDEATSSLDAETESKIQEALNFLTENRTTLVIAHRLSTILKSDKIYVINNGLVVGSGNHKELVENSSIYKNFYEKQIKKN